MTGPTTPNLGAPRADPRSITRVLPPAARRVAIRRPDQEIIRDAVRAIRIFHRMSVSALARHLGTSRPRLLRLLEGCTQITVRDGRYLRNVLDLHDYHGYPNPRTGNSLHRVQADCLYAERAD